MKKLLLSMVIGILWIGSVFLANTYAAWFTNQNASSIWVAWAQTGGIWNTGFIDFVQTAINWILGFLAMITIIILIWGGFQMVTAAWDEGKYKKGFTIVKQAVVWIILIWASALIVNLIFSFMNTNTTTGWATWMIESQSKLA